MIDLSKISRGMTRAQVFAILGQPHDWDTGSRKYPKPTVYVYEDSEQRVELYFGYDDKDGLAMAMEQPSHKKLLLAEPVEETIEVYEVQDD